MTATPRRTFTRSGARQHVSETCRRCCATASARCKTCFNVESPRALERAGRWLDETELAEADIQEHIEVALIQMKGETLRRVQDALVRLDAGEYGFCVECGGEISKQRLQALPFAVRCMACEEPHEQQAARSDGPLCLRVSR